ncbi:hypothetical protein CLAIMM_03659 [Cladophialophora immunda]|nr:hypothetical protein CLAIMM_03659 [Cladophialophora immunda]
MVYNYRIVRMLHPTHLVLDLDAAEKFLLEVFGRKCDKIEAYLPPPDKAPGFPRDYSITTMIADVWFDCIDPRKYVVDDQHFIEPVDQPHLLGTGWAVEGIRDLYQRFMDSGIRSTDQRNRIGTRDRIPQVQFTPKRPIFLTLPESTGTRYQVSPAEYIGKLDARTDPSWKLPPVSADDPLSIEFCSHHTILTKNLERQTHVLVDICGGKIIHTGRNEILKTDSTYVLLADAIYELGVPYEEGSFAMNDLRSRKPLDSYHSITFKVQDLAKVEKHLRDKKIRLIHQDETTIVTDPSDAIGIPWGFTTKRVPNDSRY